ncbi:glycine betaine/L-proline ABC transporter ATP-binding protein [Amphritea opalescens]|uniref:Quaternary amine transport ATP-binding protein n=1 Tax=Amphritea opalescens TaxID=2490544 RepID=A0A430KTY2_9GAMM|nr:glycine betaine/L-proline ABC transporter ATP-binding protein [Amphritea opalescens]RTE66774.1 glycine betaine/L-proline ABC transporter ATP-binding protein [Amphritea opalescens]
MGESGKKAAATTLIKIEGLYKLFGNNPKKYMPLVHEGKSKDEILAETGHTLGLKDINLTINKGEIFVIMGLSGSGKSTLIRHFNRLIDPTEGVIEVEGTDVMKLGPKELEQFRRHKMSMVFQRFGLLPHKSVVDNVAYGLSIQGVSKAESKAKATEWLATVGLAGYEEQYPAQLSGGQQQRVGLARALCTDAEILLMDEAFSALDPLIRSEMQDQLIELQEKLHKTIIFITHDLDEALRIGDRIAILKDGEMVQQGEPEDILLNPADAYVEAFVRDVNRARALTVETVMKAPASRITADTIEEALKQMKGFKGDYGYHINDEGYQGVLTEETLQAAFEDDKKADLDSLQYEDLDAISQDAVLETVIPETLNAEYSLPVIDEEGQMTGQLSRQTLAEVLGNDDTSEDTAEEQKKS